jgi:hypothetical protein
MTITESRVSDLARSPAWIKADYHSGNDSFITFGAEEDLSSSSSESESSSSDPFTNSKSVGFDGIDDFVDVTATADHSFGDGSSDSPFSVSAWFKVDALGASEPIVGIWRVFGSQSEWLVEKANNDDIIFHTDDWDGGENARKTATNVISSTSAWYHVLCTYDGSGNSSGSKIYLDNVQVDDAGRSTSDAGYVAMHDTNRNLHIGEGTTSGRSPSSPVYFGGNIDEVVIWNKELNSTEVAEIYNSGCPDDISASSAYGNVVSWWRMGDGDTYSTLTDQKGMHDGTMTNMAAENIEDASPC